MPNYGARWIAHVKNKNVNIFPYTKSGSKGNRGRPSRDYLKVEKELGNLGVGGWKRDKGGGGGNWRDSRRSGLQTGLKN